MGASGHTTCPEAGGAFWGFLASIGNTWVPACEGVRTAVRGGVRLRIALEEQTEAAQPADVAAGHREMPPDEEAAGEGEQTAGAAARQRSKQEEDASRHEMLRT